MGKHANPAAPTPWQRLIRMLHTERTAINYIYIYAIFIGLIGLTLPLGTTAIFNLLSNGAMYSSTYLLIGVVIVGIIIGGILLIGQFTLVEAIEQRIFTRAALEFAYKLPRIRKEALKDEHPPELINRFFDILTIQKGLTKLLVDIVAAMVQIIFSAILLSFYHPVFIGFGLLTIASIVLMVILWYRPGLNSSMEESEHKYELVAHLEEVATDLEKYRTDEKARKDVMRQVDGINAKYLRARNDHFLVLRRFFTGSMLLRVVLTAGLLLGGSLFVVQRQMSLGQFVAAEVIIVQISYAVEKFLTSLNTVFDMVTGVEKVALVTDLELETETSHA
jgi:ABC-type bacteriocin/lantibiotic exporter with double-glycine peptidase domain